MRLGLSLAVPVLAGPLFAAEKPFFFQKNDRIDFVRDGR